jgi:hypothetical protein
MTTREEILNMPAGREMDALVAEKVMEQTDFSHPGFFWGEGTTEDGKDGWDGFQCPRCNADSEDGGKCCKHYSTSIAAAWEVVEKINKEHDVQIAIGKDEKENRVEVLLWGSDSGCVYAPTAPLAICRAALLAVMEVK